MNAFPIQYIEPVFRPPSEARSLILPVTNGCSWNQCTFCEMYTAPQKKFRARKDEDILADITKTAQANPGVTRVFLADGDAMVLSFRRLEVILEALNTHFPALERVSAYCLPRNIKNKTIKELERLSQLKLKILYVGAESGDDDVLARVNKGETFESTAVALEMIRAAGIQSSVMILNGLGGSSLSLQHAENSARLVNRTQPDFVSLLVVSFPLGEDRFRAAFPDYVPLTQMELFHEVRRFISLTALENTVFRSDHASNYLSLKGVLGADKARILAILDQAVNVPGSIPLRPEWARGL